MTSDPNPRLRPVEINPVEENGERFFVLQDQQQLADQSIVVSSTGAWLLQYLNGENSRDEILSAFREETGERLAPDLLDELIDNLNQHYLLQNERSRERMNSLIADFRDREVRPSALAGRSLPDGAEELTAFLDETLPPVDASSSVNEGRGLVVPHIDFVRGKETYANLLPYLEAIDSDVERIVILGISHYTCPVPFALTDKPFESPLGRIRTDEDGVRSIEEVLPYDRSEGEIAHRLEHSIEIPLLLLQYARPELDFEIVPVICSYRSESEHSRLIETVSDRLDEMVEDPGTYLMAGVDFAHMGPEFGDAEPLEDEDFEALQEHDREMIHKIEEADATGFEEHIQANGNRRRVCGYPALRTILPLFDSGEPVDYDQWQDPRETVTYGSLVMT